MICSPNEEVMKWAKRENRSIKRSVHDQDEQVAQTGGRWIATEERAYSGVGGFPISIGAVGNDELYGCTMQTRRPTPRQFSLSFFLSTDLPIIFLLPLILSLFPAYSTHSGD